MEILPNVGFPFSSFIGNTNTGTWRISIHGKRGENKLICEIHFADTNAPSGKMRRSAKSFMPVARNRGYAYSIYDMGRRRLGDGDRDSARPSSPAPRRLVERSRRKRQNTARKPGE